MRSSPLVTRAAFAGLVALTALTLTACPQKPEPEPTPEPPKIEEPGPYTPRWAFRPWISKDISDRDDTFAFVNGFKERGIPVGAVVLDSPWATNYNSFVPNPSRYGDFTVRNSSIPPNHQSYDAQWVLDVSANYRPSEQWTLTLGADNVLDEYPDRNWYVNSTSGVFPYSNYSPAGFNGAFVYGRVAYAW